ncbi:MAG: GNAT family N-acetyltransferase [Candidatus Xenobia bacterium]
MSDLALARPTQEHVPLLAHLTFLLCEHTPYESEQEMADMLRGGHASFIEGFLLVLKAGKVIGVARIGPYRERMSLLGFSLLPPLDGPRLARRILEWALQELRSAFPTLDHAYYEDPWRPIYEAVGFQTLASMKRMAGAIPLRPVPPVSGVVRRATEADIPALAELMVAAYRLGPEEAQARAAESFGSHLARVGSFVAEREAGGLAAAVLILGRRSQKCPTLAHAITHPGEQKKGWGTALVQSSFNAAAEAGCTEMDSWVMVENDGVMPLINRFGWTRRGPLRHEGLLR